MGRVTLNKMKMVDSLESRFAAQFEVSFVFLRGSAEEVEIGIGVKDCVLDCFGLNIGYVDCLIAFICVLASFENG